MMDKGREGKGSEGGADLHLLASGPTLEEEQLIINCTVPYQRLFEISTMGVIENRDWVRNLRLRQRDG